MDRTFYRASIVTAAGLLVLALDNVSDAFPSRGASCTTCHSSPGGSLNISPNPLEIQLGDSGLLTFSVTSLGGEPPAAISVQELENPLLDASIGAGGGNWTHYTNSTWGMSYVSNVFSSTGPYTMNLVIGGSATPGDYPIVVMLAGGPEEWGTETGFTLRLLAAGIAGDYNGNGVVDAADYTTWRDTLGQSGAGLAADGTGSGLDGIPDGVVDQFDYLFWKMNFGSSGSGSLLASTVPEPTSMALLLMAMLAPVFWRARSRARPCHCS